MKIKTTTVSIGIPAYNEEVNIKRLIVSLLDQRLRGLDLVEIIVISDGSTDRTVNEVQSLKTKLVKLEINTQRKGKVDALNWIFNNANGEVLVLVDADVLPLNKSFVRNITHPILIDKHIGIVGAETISVNPETFFERIMADSHKYKNLAYRKINHGDNIYLCHGRAMALNRSLYKELKLTDNYPTDSQSYLYCLSKNYRFKFEPKARVQFKSPVLLLDHMRQHNRFINGREKLKKQFSTDLINRQYSLPGKLIIKTSVKFFLGNPITMLSYSILILSLSLLTLFNHEYTSKWSVANSTKKLLLEI
jgi:glycosyltransferase involved in cell wall biosynthesis